MQEPWTDFTTRVPHKRVSSGRNFGLGRWVIVRLGLVVVVIPMIGLVACSLSTSTPGGSGRDRNPGPIPAPGMAAPVLPAPVTRLTLRVLASLRAGQDPAVLSQAGLWQVDRMGRLDLVISVRGHLAPLVRWIRRQGSRIVAVVPLAHECEAWIPADQVARLSRRPGVVRIRFPHYAMNRKLRSTQS